MVKLSSNAMEVLNKRYLQKDKNGNVVETSEQMFRRVAKHIAKAERTPELQREWEEKFYNVITNLEFLPNSPTLRNAGANSGVLAACFVLPIEDSRSSIFKTLTEAVEVQSWGGGTGYSFSNLRPKGDLIRTTGGSASGPCSFMEVYDFTIGEIIEQGGTRKGAQLATLLCNHPDIFRFIDCKKQEGKLTHFNISVSITDNFMEKLNKDEGIGDWSLEFEGRGYSLCSTKELWDKIIYNAWENGEPGILFIDTINKKNPCNKYQTIESSNPCGESPLASYESCVLGSINLANFVIRRYFPPNLQKPLDGGLDFDWDKLKSVIKVAVRFLDNIIDVNNYPIPEIERETKKFRKIGIGVMGWADALIKLNTSYSSQQALALAEKIMKFINTEAISYSKELAIEKGFGTWKTQTELSTTEETTTELATRRNGVVTVIAPTGTLSLIAGCSAGIEPIFALEFNKKCIDKEIVVKHPLWEEYTKSHFPNIVPDCLGIKPEYFIESKDVPIEQHIRMQAAFQRHTEGAVSKTINAPNSATIENVDYAFKLAFELGCKGITFYRQGSREDEAQTPIVDKGHVVKSGPTHQAVNLETAGSNPVVSANSEETLFPPEWMWGGRQMVKTGEGTQWIHLFEDPVTGYREMWSQISKEGRTISSMNAATGRLATLALNRGATWEEVEKQLRGIIGEKTAWFGGEQILSPPDAMAKTIRKRILKNPEWNKMLLVLSGQHNPTKDMGSAPTPKFQSDKEIKQLHDFGFKIANELLGEPLCPDCAFPLTYDEGCKGGRCGACGWSNCS